MEHSVNSIWGLSAVIFFVVVISKIFAKKTATVDVLWLIIFGAIFANFGIIPTENEIFAYIGELGIIFVMFALGFEENLHSFLKTIKKSYGIAIIGAMFPFLAGFLTALHFGYSTNIGIIWGLTMTTTAVTLTMMSLKAQKLEETPAAKGIMTAAVVDSVASLIGLTIIVPLVLVSATPENTGATNTFLAIGIILAKVVAFFFLAVLLRIFIFHDRESQILLRKYNFLKRFFKFSNKFFEIVGVKKILGGSEGEFTPVILLAMAVGMGALSEEFGFHPAIGAYIVGLILQKHHFLKAGKKCKNSDCDGDNEIYKESKNVIDHVAFTIFGPIFFVMLGAKLIFDAAIFMEVVVPVLTLFSAVFIFQILAASFAARFTGSFEWKDSVMIGFGMLGRAELAFIVINIAFVQEKIIDENQFYILMFTAFLLNVSVPLMLKFWEPYYKGKKKLSLFGVKISG